jgi:hypothetical protein
MIAQFSYSGLTARLHSSSAPCPKWDEITNNWIRQFHLGRNQDSFPGPGAVLKSTIRLGFLFLVLGGKRLPQFLQITRQGAREVHLDARHRMRETKLRRV